MPRIAVAIEYDGSSYAGWQQQAHARGVQGELERALALADAAIAYAMFSFLMPAPDSVLTGSGDGTGDAGPWVPNGAPRVWRFAGT